MLRKRRPLTFEQKYSIRCLKLTLNKSYREIEKILQIPKSTAQYNYSSICAELDAIASETPDPTEHLVFFLLTGIFYGNMSVRGAEAMIEQYFGQSVSHQTLLSILEEAARIAKRHNNSISLEYIDCAIFDEIFKGSDPILAMADAVSGLLFLKAVQDRSAESWKAFLEELKAQGLDPKSVNTDGAASLLKALLEIFSNAQQMRDFFHLLQKLSKAKRAMEGICYGLIKAEDRKKDLVTAEKCQRAIDLFDRFEQSLKELQNACYLANQGGSRPYISANELKEVIYQCTDLLEHFSKNLAQHKAIHDAITYLENGGKAIIAYKKLMEAQVVEVFGLEEAETILSRIMPIIEAMAQYQRSYESRARQEYWGRKATELIDEFRGWSGEETEVIEQMISKAWKIFKSTSKSNSFIEAVNSVIRTHLNTFKSIPAWFCELFTFFWNHRTFSRGKRKDHAPIGLYRPDIDQDQGWVALIMKEFPFEKFRSGLEPIKKLAAA
jgi:transposase-like protein